jgi:hypothetical protein
MIPAVLLTLAGFANAALAQAGKPPTAVPAPAAITCTNIFGVAPQGQLDIEWRAQSQKRIEVSSNDTKERKLTSALGDLGLKDLAGNSLKTADLVEVQPAQSLVRGGQVLQVTITVKKTPAVRPGVYIGSLLLALDGDNAPKSCSTRLSLRVTVPDAAPLMDKVTLRQYRLLPFSLPFRYVGCVWYDCVISLRGPVTSLTDSAAGDAPLGLLQNDRGHTAAVYRGQPVHKVGIIDLPLDVRGSAYAGNYEGQLRLSPSSEKSGSVQLSLVVTDWFLWPIAVIALSMWLGLRVQRYLNVERTLWQLRGQEAALGVAFQVSQQKFAEAGNGKPYAAYSITENLASTRKNLREKLSVLRAATGTTLDPTNQDYKSVLDEFESLRKQVAAWGGFAAELAALQTNLGDQSELGTPPAGYKNKIPEIFAAYGGFLVGGKLTLAEFSQRREEVQQATKGAGLWYALKRRLDRGEERYANLKQVESSMSPADKEKLATSKDSLLATGLALWEAKDIDEVQNLSAELGTLDTAEQTLRTLTATYGVTPPVDAATTVAHALTTEGNLAMLSRAFGLGPEPDNEPVDDAERARYYAAATNKWDKWLTLLAFVIATLSGLNSYYLGKPFGTLKDYIGLLLLGFGTKLSVDAVSAIVGWVFQNRQRISNGSA